MTRVSLAEAKARLSQLVDRAEAGESIEITRRGKPAARLTAVTPARKPIDIAAMEALSATTPFHEVSAGEFMRAMRDAERY
jgi:prevent-host-death family protein